MNNREEILVHYALLLALYGEDSQQAKDFASANTNADNTAALIEVVLLYRQLSSVQDRK